jgi:hypothetical protein
LRPKRSITSRIRVSMLRQRSPTGGPTAPWKCPMRKSRGDRRRRIRRGGETAIEHR